LERLKIVLIGPVKDEGTLQLIQELGLAEKVLLAGEMAEAADAAKAFDLFVMPSRSEGLCRALIEAMQQGVCPVVSDAGGMKELVRDGIDGRVFPTRNTDDLAAALRQLYHDPSLRTRMSVSARERVAQLCTPSVVCEKLLDIYQTVIADRQQSMG
jgi:glycosyltransferase involved in cell wall biosynthesis